MKFWAFHEQWHQNRNVKVSGWIQSNRSVVIKPSQERGTSVFSKSGSPWGKLCFCDESDTQATANAPLLPSLSSETLWFWLLVFLFITSALINSAEGYPSQDLGRWYGYSCCLESRVYSQKSWRNWSISDHWWVGGSTKGSVSCLFAHPSPFPCPKNKQKILTISKLSF